MMKHTLFSRLLRDRGGNFGVMTAAMLPVLLGVAGMAIDVTNAMQERNRLQALADAATLAAASAMADKDMTETEAVDAANTFLFAQAEAECKATGKSAEECQEEIAARGENTATEAETTTTSDNGEAFEVRMTTSYDVPLSGLSSVLGFRTLRVTVSSSAQSSRKGNALSMYLALDESGSMAWDTTTINSVQPTKQEAYNCGNIWQPKTCYRTINNYLTKMESLKAAAAVLFSELKKAAAPETTDPTLQEIKAQALIRIGAVSYDDKTKKEKVPAWGTKSAGDYVNALPKVPDGGTDASGAMKVAYDALASTNTTETAEHAKKDNTSFGRFIVLMTDGEMTGNSNTWNKTIDDKVQVLCKQAKDDGITVFTVAFMAPEKGKALLSKCASGEDYYYESDDMEELVTDFGDIGRKAAKTATRLTN
ncbi:Flp pilus assembly protein TadG [Xaviernesmea oryzae]|uniref:Flp pilus assembly protein TadG n=1 Tax=Xaviernesmea oryzae TaxID=464029 RepID=A0A1X7CZX0_9HYPH|nr:TadE/TadG family type IV pilus assembly protein [Xaviernesmea oryzae]SMF06071.1 Flp pilus assembly protein TadG [Xaviernesmea oryzae]